MPGKGPLIKKTTVLSDSDSAPFFRTGFLDRTEEQYVIWPSN